MTQLEHIEAIERRLWTAADTYGRLRILCWISSEPVSIVSSAKDVRETSANVGTALLMIITSAEPRLEH